MNDVSTCGSLVIGGFPGSTLTPATARALRAGERGGVIFFKTNVAGGPAATASLAREVRAAAPSPVLVGIDQEGGRVARLRAPLLEVPPMRTVASWGDVAFAERIARAVGVELAALGITIDFAPVLDVNTSAENPIIGDRAFGNDPETCARFGAAWIRGLQSAGILACGKHFPGHGDTTKDSHLELPRVDQSRERLERVELAPFRAAVAAGAASMMTAHVVYCALDALPATLSRVACSDLRDAIGFRGMLVSDDLEMQAIAARWSVEEAAVLAVDAGCDALLVCLSEEKQERAVAALVREAERSPAFRARCVEASRRVREATARATATAAPDDAAVGRAIGSRESVVVAGEMARRAGRAAGA